ncbi:hypothetical protein DXX93_20660 [Thalassotalea euphylliae]|uniref:Uncharacterized protein n=1 Tax=Thalassotalea euphylliae TaxID=1655234 RepID=A0A3E0TWM0_9GAMM|nr:hypothetical protein [Thalassotalea euphylliae]REL28743.1 hypothetical protein DXX93_20660 [Thalassotalea euphylliae]
MKVYSIIALLAFSLVACQKSDQASEAASSTSESIVDPTLAPASKQEAEKLDARYQGTTANDAVASAIVNQDFRLLSTSTRMPQFPGTDQSRYHEYKALCGANFLPNMGDVKLQGDNSGNRQQVKQYMAEYNLLMLEACLNHHHDGA